MKVIITKCEHKGFWYSIKIGEVFEVFEEIQHGNNYRCRENITHMIGVEDCEVLPDFDLTDCMVKDIEDEDMFIEVCNLSGLNWTDGDTDHKGVYEEVPKSYYDDLCINVRGLLGYGTKKYAYSHKKNFILNVSENPFL
jgi:hypothetical protein